MAPPGMLEKPFKELWHLSSLTFVLILSFFDPHVFSLLWPNLLTPSTFLLPDLDAEEMTGTVAAFLTLKLGDHTMDSKHSTC